MEYIGSIYLLVGVLFAIAAWFTPVLVLKALLLWCALSVFVVGVAYVLNKPAIFRKRLDGRITWWTRWLFIPFLLFAKFYNEIVRSRDKVPRVQKISPNLYLAGRLTRSTLPVIESENITAVLDVTAEFDALNWESEKLGIQYLNVPVLDHSIPTVDQLNKAIRWIDHQISGGGKVVVHCALGRGRSVLVMMAYLIVKHKKDDIRAMLSEVKEIRNTANLNRKQYKHLHKLYTSGKLELLQDAWIIANPNSGSGNLGEIKPQIINALKEYYNLTLREMNKQQSPKQLVEQAKANGAKMIIACGGDGTVAAVAEHVANSNIRLGIIPNGTANSVAKVLFGLTETTTEAACNILIEGNVRTIDTATCNDKMMMLVAGVGFEETMVREAVPDKESLGQMAYIKSLWSAISENKNLSIKMTLDGDRVIEAKTPSLTIANIAPITSVLAQGNGEPEYRDGLLDITWLDTFDASHAKYMSMFDLTMAGFSPEAAKSNENIHHCQAKTIELEIEGAENYVLDGEIFEDLPLTIKVQPSSLHVLAPELAEVQQRQAVNIDDGENSNSEEKSAA
ncbi:diacylglycerol kinase family protein [Sessilibacter sp. MAH1]